MPRSERSRTLRFLLATFAATLGALIAPQAMAVENGDVLIGRSADRSRLDDIQATDPLLVVIDTPYQVFDDAGTILHVAAWTPEGDPADGAEVYLEGHLVGRADRTGTFAFRWGVPGSDVEDYWLNGSRIEVRWRNAADGVSVGSVWFSAFSRTESYESDHLYVYTDRGVYAPGDTLHARLIAWHLAADYGPVDGGEVELTLVGPDGRTVSGAAETTDEYGTAAAAVELPSTLAEGVYELSVAYAGATAMTRLRVERFVPPVIRIDHTLGRFLTLDTSTLSWDVSLSYVEGGMPESATVTVDAIVNGETRFSRTVGVTGPGPHPFEIGADDLAVVLGGLVDRSRFDIRLTVEDADGRVDELTRDITYAIDPYVAVIESDRDAWSTGDPIELIVRVTDVERVPLRDTPLRLTGTGDTVWTARTDESGTAQFSLQMGDVGFEVSLFVDGVDTPLATRWLNWQEPQPMRSHVADAIVRENESTRVRVTFPSNFEPAEEVVHMDVTDISGSLVNAVLLDITRDRDGVYTAEGEFSAPSWGSMLLTFFCLGSGDGIDVEAWGDAGHATPLGLMTEGQNVAVHPGRELAIVLDGVTSPLEPGASFGGTISVTDSDGHAVDAAVGVAMVDEGVIALKDPLEITPMDHFYNPELRVISTTGSAILTWPVVSRNWGYETHDIALPPFPFKAGGPIEFHTGAVAGEDGEYIEPAPDEAMEAEADGYFEMSGAGLSGGGAGYGVGYGAAAAPMASGSIGTLSGDFLDDADMAADPASAETRTSSRSGRGEAEPPVTITIRTERPDTSLWIPDLRTDHGTVGLSASVPDAITRQQVTIVASDARGGVGVARVSLEVTQPLSVRSDLPPTVVRGDPFEARVAVSNRTDAPREVVLVLRSDDLEVTGTARTVSVGAGETIAVAFDAVAPWAGDAAFTVVGTSADLSDGVAETVRVLPSGDRTREILANAVSGGSTYEVDLAPSPDAEWRELTLSVTFPALTSAFAGMDLVSQRIAEEPVDELAGDLVTALLVYEAQRDAGTGDVDGWRVRLQGAVETLQVWQLDGGGWRAWWSESPSVFLSAWCVEALTEARRLDFSVDLDALRAGAAFVADAISAGPLDLSTIDFWEGNTASVEAGVRAEALHVLARIPLSVLGDELHAKVVALVQASLPLLDTDTPELMSFAHTLGAAVALEVDGEPLLDDDRIAPAVDRLVSLSREGHWEPSWFSAYGGTIEATVTILEVLRDVDSDSLDRVARDSLRYLMSTSDALGSWHNERGSAWLLRGLALVAAPAPEGEATVRILVDGEEVDRVVVDPDDPYQSALRLRSIDLSHYLRAGAQRFGVSYDGTMAPRAEFVSDVWR